MDGAGLFVADSSTAAPAAFGAKRMKLSRLDHMSVQGFDPNGVSAIEGMSLERLWRIVETGNTTVAFYSNLASTEDLRVGIGLSQAAQALETAITRLDQPMMKKLIDPVAMKKAQDEARHLMPALTALNQGAKRTSSGAHDNQISIDDAAKIYFDWSKQPSSPLRSILNLLSGGGVYYAAAVHEKVSRAWIVPNDKTVDDVQRAAKARQTAAPPSAPSGCVPDDTCGLFECDDMSTTSAQASLDATEPRLELELSATDNLMAVTFAHGNM